MFIKIFKILCLELCFSLVFLSGVAFAENNKNCSYKVGVVPQFEQRRIFEVWSTILDNLKIKTGCDFELVGSTSIVEFEKSFKKGLYDFAYMNPYHAVIARKVQGYEPIIRSGLKKLKGIIVVKKDSSIKDVKELDNKEIAFPSPNAFGATILIRAELSENHNTNVKAKYVKTHSSVYLHVAKGIMVAGGGVARTLAAQPDYIKNALRVIFTTRPVKPHPLVAHPRVGDDNIKKVQMAWLKLSEEQPDLFNGIPMKNSMISTYADYKQLEDLGLEAFIRVKN